MKGIGIFISGRGSNFQALYDSTQTGELKGLAHIAVVHSNNPNAAGLDFAKAHNLSTVVISNQAHPNRPLYETALIEALEPYSCDLICLAGYMRILSPVFVREYASRLLNIHPSLLPKYPGLHTHAKVLQNLDTTHGATVHFVTEALDAGPRIAQSHVAVLPGDTEAELAERILEKEHLLYSKAVKWFCENRLSCDGEQAYLDGTPILFNNDYENEKDFNDDGYQ